MKAFVILALCALACAEKATNTREKRGLHGYSSYVAPSVSYVAPSISYSAPISYTAPAVSYSAPISYVGPAARVVSVNKVVHEPRVVSVPQVVHVRKLISEPRVVSVNHVVPAATYSSYSPLYSGVHASYASSYGW